MVSALDFINVSVPPWVRDSRGRAYLTQQDCHEYLNYLLDQLDEKSFAEDSIVNQLFTGEISFSVKCLNCYNVSVTRQPFKVLNLSFPKCDESKNLTLEDLFAHWIAPETLTGECQYECDACNGRHDAERSQAVTKLGNYFILTLGRYRSFRGKGEKIRNDVSYPFRLESPLGNGDNYKLNAVIFHHGYSLNHGHYYSCARESDNWILFNDAIVRDIPIDCLKSVTKRDRDDSAYVLIYTLENASNEKDLSEKDLRQLLMKFRHILKAVSQELFTKP